MYVFKKVVFNFYKEFIFFNSYLKNYIKTLFNGIVKNN